MSGKHRYIGRGQEGSRGMEGGAPKANTTAGMRMRESIIQSRLLPAWTGKAPPNAADRDLFALPARLGGLGIVNPSSHASKEFSASVQLSSPPVDLILQQNPVYSLDTQEEQVKAQSEIRKERLEAVQSAADSLMTTVQDSLRHAMTLAREKGASTWLTSLPLEEHGFSLHKGAFRDALALRYGWLPSNTPTSCACGKSFSVEHALSCPTPQRDT